MLFVGASILPIVGLAQDEEPQRTLGLGARIQTGGIGFELYYSRKIDLKWSWFLSSSFVSQKESREVRIESLYNDQGGSAYVFDKINYAYALNLLYGREYTISPMTSFSRLKFTFGFSAGPSLGLLKPVYYKIVQQTPSGTPVLRSGTYRFGPDPQADYLTLYGEDNFFTGVNNMAYVPGLCLQLNATMNLSGDFLNLKGVQTGVRMDWFSRKLNILDVHPDRRLFFNLYVGLLVGNSW